MSKNTLIMIEKETHKIAKENAKKNGMTLMGYIKILVEKDNKKE